MIKKYYNKQIICQLLEITNSDFDKLVEYYNINYKEYHILKSEKEYLRRYNLIVDNLGHHPSITEMNLRKEWIPTYHGILKYWGSIQNFRKEYSIKKPKRKLSKFIRKNIEEKKRKKDELLTLIKNEGPVRREIISNKLDICQSTILVYLKELLNDNLIEKINSDAFTKYSIKSI